MLGFRVRICVQRRYADTVLRSCPPDSPKQQFVTKMNSVKECFPKTYKAISPLFATRIELRGDWPPAGFATVEAALVVDRIAADPSRGVVRRSEDRGIALYAQLLFKISKQ